MSANNWTECPKCRVLADAEKLAKQKAAAEAYGKVSPEEWQRMTKEADASGDLDETLREDWEIGLWKNRKTGIQEFYASFSASCEVCGFSHKFKHEEPLSIDGNKSGRSKP